jgi:hypothetical protein
VAASGPDQDGTEVNVLLELDRRGRLGRLRIERSDDGNPLRFPRPKYLTRRINESEPLELPPPEVQRDVLPRERAVINFLLDEEFDGRDELRQQLATARVIPARSRDPQYIRFAVDPRAPLWPENLGLGCPVRADGVDSDGMPIDVSLHLDRLGRAKWLDIVRYTGDPPLVYPTPETLKRDGS